MKLEDFNDEAQICAQRRLARTEDAVQSIDMAMYKLGGTVIGVYFYQTLQQLSSTNFLLRSQRSLG